MDDRLRIKNLEIELQNAKDTLNQIEKDCSHEWGNTEDVSIHHDGYIIPGDSLGVDSRPEHFVSARVENRWKRVCEKCGRKELTGATKKNVEEVPSF